MFDKEAAVNLSFGLRKQCCFCQQAQFMLQYNIMII